MRMASEWVAGSASHIGISVPDLDEARAFYCDLLGFQEVWNIHVDEEMIDRIGAIDGGERIYNDGIQLLVPGGCRLEIQQYEPQGSQVPRKMNDVGFNHLAFSVADLQYEYDRLKAAGVEFLSEPIPMEFGDNHPISNRLHVYFNDPWGTRLQLLGPMPGKTPINDEKPASRTRTA
jgi:catechol 2,3-dioxygenase-like lactoylglutathione lyase family enzyme